jgi:pimeloyl-ACP methyl ester carboxylesterase
MIRNKMKQLSISRILKSTGIVGLIYVVVCFLFWLFQDKFIFQPDKLDQDYTFQFDFQFEEFFIEANDGVQLNALLFQATQPSKGLILYFHGNADNLQRWGKYAVDLTAQGYDVLMPEYRGYGKSGGKPGEQAFYDDAEKVLAWAKENLKVERIIFYGRSLGSGVASQLATQHSPDLLILETPFDNLNGVVYPPIKPLLWFLPLHYTFSNDEHLKKVTCRKVIIHGTDDWVVPVSSALRLKPLLKNDDVFVIIEDGGHKDLRKFKEYHAVLKQVLQ